MRVTHRMITEQTTGNLSAAVARLLHLQNLMSTGRRINRPSDDPIGITRDLSYRTTISTVEQYQRNINSARTQLNTAEQSLGTISNLLVSAREIATSLADDMYDATARQGAAREAQSILDQILQASNTQSEGRYIFAGHQTRTQAFLATPGGVVYQGDRGMIYSQIESSSQVAVNVIGSDFLLSPLQTLGEGFDLNRGISTAALLADLHQGNGVDLAPGIIQVTDDNVGVSVSVDLSSATTIGDVVSLINTQLASGGINGVTASVSPNGNNLRLEATDNGLISTSTQLSNLNRGDGVDLSPGIIRVTTDDGSIDVAVDLSGASTVGDAISAFNTQVAAAGINNVTMDINPAQTGLRIRDTNTNSLGLRIADPQEESTALGLGLVGYVNAEMTGSDLNPSRVISVTDNGGGETTAFDLGILGTFTNLRDGEDLDPILTTTTPLAELNNGNGLSLGSIHIAQGDKYAVVDLATAVTIGDVIDRINAAGLEINAGLNAAARGIQVVSTADDKSLIISEESGAGGAATLGIKGSPDLLGNMMLLVTALDSNDREMIGNLLNGLSKASDSILDTRAAVGANIRRMDATENRLSDLTLSMQRLLSEVEDADIIKVTTDLATQQNIYQAALSATARVLTPSLADFLR